MGRAGGQRVGSDLKRRNERVDLADEFGQLVVGIVGLAGEPVDPSLITPVALMLRAEGLSELPDVTFGCNYDLDVRSFELERGLGRAIDSGWLLLRSRKVSVSPSYRLAAVSRRASDRASELFALDRKAVMLAARRHLLA